VSAYTDVALAAAAFALFFRLEIWRENGAEYDAALLVCAGLVAGFLSPPVGLLIRTLATRSIHRRGGGPVRRYRYPVARAAAFWFRRWLPPPS
jgi:hypothetical protein